MLGCYISDSFCFHIIFQKGKVTQFACIFYVHTCRKICFLFEMICLPFGDIEILLELMKNLPYLIKDTDNNHLLKRFSGKGYLQAVNDANIYPKYRINLRVQVVYII